MCIPLEGEEWYRISSRHNSNGFNFYDAAFASNNSIAAAGSFSGTASFEGEDGKAIMLSGPTSRASGFLLGISTGTGLALWALEMTGLGNRSATQPFAVAASGGELVVTGSYEGAFCAKFVGAGAGAGQLRKPGCPGGVEIKSSVEFRHHHSLFALSLDASKRKISWWVSLESGDSKFVSDVVFWDGLAVLSGYFTMGLIARSSGGDETYLVSDALAISTLFLLGIDAEDGSFPPAARYVSEVSDYSAAESGTMAVVDGELWVSGKFIGVLQVGDVQLSPFAPAPASSPSLYLLRFPSSGSMMAKAPRASVLATAPGGVCSSDLDYALSSQGRAGALFTGCSSGDLYLAPEFPNSTALLPTVLPPSDGGSGSSMFLVQINAQGGIASAVRYGGEQAMYSSSLSPLGARGALVGGFFEVGATFGGLRGARHHRYEHVVQLYYGAYIGAYSDAVTPASQRVIGGEVDMGALLPAPDGRSAFALLSYRHFADLQGASWAVPFAEYDTALFARLALVPPPPPAERAAASILSELAIWLLLGTAASVFVFLALLLTVAAARALHFCLQRARRPEFLGGSSIHSSRATLLPPADITINRSAAAAATDTDDASGLYAELFPHSPDAPPAAAGQATGGIFSPFLARFLRSEPVGIPESSGGGSTVASPSPSAPRRRPAPSFTTSPRTPLASGRNSASSVPKNDDGGYSSFSAMI